MFVFFNDLTISQKFILIEFYIIKIKDELEYSNSKIRNGVFDM